MKVTTSVSIVCPPIPTTFTFEILPSFPVLIRIQWVSPGSIVFLFHLPGWVSWSSSWRSDAQSGPGGNGAIECSLCRFIYCIPMKRIATVLLCLLAQPALAAMSLDKIIVYLHDLPNSREDIVVSNPDQETLYLQTEIYRVENAGLPNEERIRVVNPDEFKLLISPSRAVIPAGAEKRFRLMSLDRDLEKEQVYRVTFKPVVGELKSEKNALKILVAYQVLIFVQPQDGDYQLSLERQGAQLSLANRGNINVEVVEMEYCRAQECRPMTTRGRIYAEARLLIEDEWADDLSGGVLRLRARGREMETIEIPL